MRRLLASNLHLVATLSEVKGTTEVIKQLFYFHLLRKLPLFCFRWVKNGQVKDELVPSNRQEPQQHSKFAYGLLCLLPSRLHVIFQDVWIQKCTSSSSRTFFRNIWKCTALFEEGHLAPRKFAVILATKSGSAWRTKCLATFKTGRAPLLKGVSDFFWILCKHCWQHKENNHFKMYPASRS